MAHIIIDGYNLIRRSPVLSRIEAGRLERGRQVLLKQLSAYHQLKGHRITVVFDAASTFNPQVEEDRFEGIAIFYSKRNQSADQVIKHMIHGGGSETIIVSSDREIQKAARHMGCGFLESDEFEKKLREASMYENALASKEPEEEKRPLHKRWITYKKGPSYRPPKARRKAMNRV